MATTKTKRPVPEAVALLKDLLEAVNRPAEGSKAYAGAVEYMATILRPRFETGERPAMKSTTRARACGSLTPCPPGPRPRAAQAAPRGRA